MADTTKIIDKFSYDGVTYVLQDNNSGYTSNVGTVTGVKVNGTTISPQSGVVDLGNIATSSSIPSPATATPLMDGTAAVGTATKYAREDHVHPTDTSRLGGIILNTSAEPYDVPVSAYGVATITIGEGLGVSDSGNTATLKAKIKTINSTSLLGSGNVAVQPTLVSGTNIKTINNESLLGSGNISIPTPSAIDASTIHTKAVAGWGSVANITSGEGVQF